MYNYPHFAPKQTSARIDFWELGGRLVDGKGTHNVKFLTENETKSNCAVCTCVGNGIENTYAYDHQRERLQGMLLTGNGDCIMETQKTSWV